MTLLEKLEIKNFRGFDKLEIDGLSKINLFVGKNNSGKTSILEAVFLLMGMSNPMLPNDINQVRGLNLRFANQFKYLFHNLKFDNKPFFKGIFNDTVERELEFNAKFQQQKNDFSSIIYSDLLSSEITGVDLIFSKRRHGQKKTTKKSSIFYDVNGTIQHLQPKDYKEILSATYVSPDKNDFGALLRYSDIVKRKDESLILKSLQAFDNSIISVKPLTDGIYFELNDVDELVPSNIMGDGIRHFLNIVTAVFAKQDSFVLIDEIENGLHYSAYQLLWRSILSFSAQNDVQLFITTHNIETLESLKSVLEETQYENMRDFAKVFKIANTKLKRYQSYKYSFNEFKTAIDNEIEIRR